MLLASKPHCMVAFTTFVEHIHLKMLFLHFSAVLPQDWGILCIDAIFNVCVDQIANRHRNIGVKVNSSLDSLDICCVNQCHASKAVIVGTTSWVIIQCYLLLVSSNISIFVIKNLVTQLVGTS